MAATKYYPDTDPVSLDDAEFSPLGADKTVFAESLSALREGWHPQEQDQGRTGVQILDGSAEGFIERGRVEIRHPERLSDAQLVEILISEAVDAGILAPPE